MPDATPPTLFTPLKVGAFELAHRVVMPALRRGRAGPAFGVPNELMVRYYGQRATRGGLVVTETSWIHADGHGDGREPGLYTPEQVNAWRAATDAVHARGATVVAQLGDPDPPAGGGGPRIDATMRRVRDAAECAGDAGFDGVEFLASWPDCCFGDPADNTSQEVADRVGLWLDVLHTLAGVLPSERVGLRLAAAPGQAGEHDRALVTAVSGAVRAGVAYVHVGSPWPRVTGRAPDRVAEVLPLLRPAGGVLIASGGFDARSADALLRDGHADAVAFGRAFMTNPDLPWRLHCGAPLAPDVPDETGSGAAGYTDHPVSDLVPANVNGSEPTPGTLRCDAAPWRHGLR